MAAVLIDFAARKVIRPMRDHDLPREPPPPHVRTELRMRWHRAFDEVVATRYERDAARRRWRLVGRNDAGHDPLDVARIRTTRAYDEARIVLMRMPAWGKECVRWKWTQLTNLAARTDEWEDMLDADEDWLGLAGSRPPPPPERQLEALARPDYGNASPWAQIRNSIELIK